MGVFQSTESKVGEEQNTTLVEYLYSKPPIFDQLDARQKMGNYGLMHMAMNVTIRRCFMYIIYFLKTNFAMGVFQSTKSKVGEEQNTTRVTYLYSKPPIFDQWDERKKIGNYGLMHMAMNITVRRSFMNIIYFLRPKEALSVLQASKILSRHVMRAQKNILYFLLKYNPSEFLVPQKHRLWHFQWPRLLNDQITSKREILWLINQSPYRSNQIVINKEGVVLWHNQKSLSLVVTKNCIPPVVLEGQVFIFYSKHGRHQERLEIYDLMLQRKKKYKSALPIPNLRSASTVVFNGMIYIIGGYYFDAAINQIVISNKVYCYHKETKIWIEQASINHARLDAAVIVFEGKIWLFGGRSHPDCGRDQHYDYLNVLSLELFDPTKETWKIVGTYHNNMEHCISAFFVINDSLCVATTTMHSGFFMFKYISHNSTWELFSNFDCRDHYGYNYNRPCRNCTITCNSNSNAVYFLSYVSYGTTKFSKLTTFNTDTLFWASENVYKSVYHAKLLCITSECKKWTRLS